MAKAETVTEEVTPVVETVVEEPKKEDPTKALKKQIKELKAEVESLSIALDKETDLNRSLVEKNRVLEEQLNRLCLNYSRISKYIVDSTNLFRQNILMILKEDER